MPQNKNTLNLEVWNIYNTKNFRIPTEFGWARTSASNINKAIQIFTNQGYSFTRDVVQVLVYKRHANHQPESSFYIWENIPE